MMNKISTLITYFTCLAKKEVKLSSKSYILCCFIAGFCESSQLYNFQYESLSYFVLIEINVSLKSLLTIFRFRSRLYTQESIRKFLIFLKFLIISYLKTQGSYAESFKTVSIIYLHYSHFPQSSCTMRLQNTLISNLLSILIFLFILNYY